MTAPPCPPNREASFYPALQGDMLSRANLFRFIREFLRASSLDTGVYMEFGVFNGESMLEAYRMLRGRISHFYGFDTFAGLPDLSPEDHEARKLMPTFQQGNMESMPRDQVERTILSQSDTVVGEDVNHRQFHQRRQPDGRTHVIGEDQESATVGDQPAVQRQTGHD